MSRVRHSRRAYRNGGVLWLTPSARPFARGDSFVEAESEGGDANVVVLTMPVACNDDVDADADDCGGGT
jgi:hypothetical protein